MSIKKYNLLGNIKEEREIAMCSLCGGGTSCSCGSCGICNCGSCYASESNKTVWKI